MRRSGKERWWIAAAILVGAFLLGGGILWQLHRGRRKHIALSDLPSLRQAMPQQRAQRHRHNGRPMQIELSSN
ncbi:MAG: hypothetical protein J7M34_03850 [Anaerolineae bacterium]|nr:hypothetical protein [Anaerolineae bacterium]